MPGWFKRNTGVVGVDLGTQTMHVAQVEFNGERPQVVAAGRRPLPCDLPSAGPARVTALASALQRLIGETGVTATQVVSALPSSQIHFKNLRLPKMPADELAAAVQWEAADRLHLATDKVQIQHFDAGEVRQGDEVRQEIILMAVSNEDVQHHLEVLLAAGLDPVAIETAPSALARAARYCGPAGREESTDGEATALIDIGHSSTKVLVARHGRVLFFKTIELGGAQLDDAVAQAMGLSLADAAELRRNRAGQSGADEPADLVGASRRENIARALQEAVRGPLAEIGREIQLCLRYYSVTFRGRRPEQAFLVGGEATALLDHPLLAEAAGVELRPAPVAEHFDLSSMPHLAHQPQSAGQYLAALGLALRRDAQPRRRGRQEVAA